MSKLKLTVGTIGAFLITLTSAVASEANTDTSSNNTTPRQIKVKAVVDSRVELMSIIFHLAGNHEYSQCKSKKFMKNVKEHFAGHKKHAAVKFAKHLKKKRGVSYDAVMSMAVHITDVNTCGELIPFEPRPGTLDGRWQTDEAREFLATCRDFVKDTDFNSFLTKNQQLYTECTDRLQKLMDNKANLNWFDDFFGPRNDVNFNLVVSIPNSGSCYGVRIRKDDKTQIYCILGLWKFSWLGYGPAEIHDGYMTTIVHEFGHSYCNPLVDKHMNEFKTFGKKFYAKQKKTMQNQAYASWQTMMRESLVRACEVRYAMAIDGSEQAERIANYQVSRGFLWTKELSDVLAKYEKQRDKYPTLGSFMPRIFEFFNTYAKSHD